MDRTRTCPFCRETTLPVSEQVGATNLHRARALLQRALQLLPQEWHRVPLEDEIGELNRLIDEARQDDE